MTVVEFDTTALSESEHSLQLRRAVIASTVGTVIEAYDFLLYVLVAPLVFAKLYFPASDLYTQANMQRAWRTWEFSFS